MPKFYELKDKKTRKVVFRGSTQELLAQAHITVNTLDVARKRGELWAHYKIREIEEPKKRIPFTFGEEQKTEEKKGAKNRTQNIKLRLVHIRKGGQKMKVIIHYDNKSEFYEADETQAEVIREFLTGSPDSVWRFGFMQGVSDNITAMIANLKLQKETIERIDNGRYKKDDNQRILGTDKHD